MSQLKNEVDVLKRVPLFSGVDAAKLKLLAFTSKVVSFKAGDVLFRQNDPGDSAYVILSGKARIFVDGPDGEIRLGSRRFTGRSV